MNAPDATPRPLYVRRELLNALDIVEWARTLKADMRSPAYTTRLADVPIVLR